MRLALRPAAVLLLALSLLLGGGAAAAFAQPAPAPEPLTGDALRLQRLEHLARLWGGVEHFHPYLAYREIDWDQALLEALPRVRAAESPEAYAAAVRAMLDRLGDPATRVRSRPQAAPGGPASAPAATADAPPLFRWEEGEVLVLDLRRLAGHSDGLTRLWEQTAALGKEVAKARAVVADLRSLPDEDSVADLRFAFEGLSRSLVHRTVQAPAERYLIHSGYAPQQGGTSGGYYSAFLTRFAESYSPPPAAADAEPPTRKRLVFLTSRASRLPLAAAALQAAGDAVIVSEGEIGDEAVAMRRTYDLGEGFEAVVRLGEILPMPGWPGVHADIVLPAPDGAGGEGEDVALRTALAEARKAPVAPAAEPRAAAGTGQPLPDAVWRPDPAYRDLKDPSPEHRLLAVFRIWNVIHYFYPYRHLIGDWDAVLPRFITRMEAVGGARDYSLAVSEMMTHVPDGHTSVAGSELLSLFGEAFLPVSLRWIEGSYVVTSVWGGAKDAGIEVGEVLVAVDGQPVEARAEFFGRILTASTDAALRNRIGGALLRGPDGSTATLKLRGRGGVTREVTATRAPFSPQPPGEEKVRILPGDAGGIGLVDLRHLERAEVDAMFEKVKDTRALIFDLRGYPRGTAWSIAPRLNVRGAAVGALFRRPQVDGFTSQGLGTEFAFAQPLPVSDQPKYTRPTVMLIDDRTISQAEHTGLFFEAAAGTVFIGTPSAGANGDVTNFFIPGGIRIGFTGHDVRHADGRQLQRVGLQPTVEVAPTLEGIRAGRDEVLEAALRYLEEKAPAAPAP